MPQNKTLKNIGTILVVDNRDSFVYNIVQLLKESGFEIGIDVKRCDALELRHLERDYAGIILSPGPGLPSESGLLLGVVAEAAQQRIPLLGICLGHQAIAEHFGGHLLQLAHPLHGHASVLHVTDDNNSLLEGADGATVGRYHSWTVDASSLPGELQTSAIAADDGCIMAVRHRTLPIWGMQFHPESYITNCGMLIIRNWLSRI